jgi:Ribonuclease G/E
MKTSKTTKKAATKEYTFNTATINVINEREFSEKAIEELKHIAAELNMADDFNGMWVIDVAFMENSKNKEVKRLYNQTKEDGGWLGIGF